MAAVRGLRDRSYALVAPPRRGADVTPRREDDGHEDTRREYATEIAILKANADREREVVEALRERSHAHGNMFGTLQLANENHEGRIDRLESDTKKGSERMEKIEASVESVNRRLWYAAGAVAALGFSAPFVGALLAKHWGL